MAIYRSRNTQIDAFKFGKDDAPSWFIKACDSGRVRMRTYYEGFCTNPEDPTVSRSFGVGDYIIMTEDGRVYPCDPEIFDSIYEKIAEA